RGSNKQLLVDAVSDILPAELRNKSKSGFELPMREWLTNGKLRPYLDSLVTEDLRLVRDGHLFGEPIRNIYDDFIQGRSHYLKPWSFIALEQWYRSIIEPA